MQTTSSAPSALIRSRVAAFAATLFLLPLSLFGQSGAATIQGTVQDPSGAAVPAATVRIVNDATSVAVETTSNNSGFFSAPGLNAGKYTATVSAPGLKKYEAAITLANGQVLVINPVLTVGDTNEKITVTGETIQLATYDSGTVNSQLDSARISQLPMNGRNVLGLAQNTVPGLESNGTRANGLMQEGMEYSQDGAPMTNRNFGGESNSAQATLPDPDSVQEARFETMNSSAQFATPATVILTTKSGTNDIHGSFFETLRNNYFGIAKSRQNPADFAAPHFVRNEFGGSVGGPIVIPKLYNGKNRSFFFFAYERFSLREDRSQLVTVPTVAMRNGDFSGLINRSGVLQQLYDPSTTQGAAQNYARQPFPNNRIPIERISPLARTLYAATPLPNRPDNPLLTSNLIDVNKITQTVPNYSTRLDHVFNENNRGYFRFTEIDQQQQALRNYPSNSPANIAGGGLPAGATGFQRIPIQTISGAAGFSHVFSPTFFSETIYSMQWQRMYVEGNEASMANYEQQLGLPNNLGNPGFPAIGVNSGTIPSLIMPYGGSQWNYGMSQRLTTIDQNFNKIWGKHQFAFGGRWRHEHFGYMSDRSTDQIIFSNLATAIYDPASGANYAARANTGYYDADFFLGAAASYSQIRNSPFNKVNLQEFDFYIQDNFRVSQHLTLNVGVRWEMHPAPRVADDLMVTFDVNNKAIATPRPLDFYLQQGVTTQAIITNLQNLGAKFETFEQGGLPSRGMYSSNGNVLPRFGFAYTPSFGRNGTVIRGGYGEYIYPVPVRNSVRYLTASYPFTASYSQSYTSASFAPDGLPNRLLREPIAVVAGLNSKDVVNTNSTTALLPGISTGTTMNTKYPPARVREINFTIEQPFQDGSVFRASYVYTHGWNLDQNLQYNNAPSTYVWMTTTGTTVPTGTYANTATRPYDQTLWGGNVQSTKNGWSNDNALQLNYQRPYRKGVGFQVFYVLSKSFRVGGNTFRDNLLYPAANYAPGVLPADMPTGTTLEPSKELNRYQNYKIETAIPLHRLTFNGIADIPVGRGKRFLGNANKWLNALVGGYQVAFVGTMVSQAFSVYANNWGATNPIELYKDSAPITDCRSGVCRPGYLWFNGYIAPNLINTPNGVQGIPENYKPYSAPINNTPGAANFGNNNVNVTLKDGRQVLTAYSPAPVNNNIASGSNPYSQTVLQGPKNFQTDMSLFKVFDITERWKLRLNVDAFNAFNIQGLRNPDTPNPTTNPTTDGILTFQQSYWTPRQIQLTARLSF